MGEALATRLGFQSYAYEMFSAVETLKAAGAERRAVSHWTNLRRRTQCLAARGGWRLRSTPPSTG